MHYLNKYLCERILEYHYCNITDVVGFFHACQDQVV